MSRLCWLVVVEKELVSFEEKYRVFREEDFQLALAWAKKNGWCDFLGMGINKKPGVMNEHRAGGVAVGIMHVEEQVATFEDAYAAALGKIRFYIFENSFLLDEDYRVVAIQRKKDKWSRVNKSDDYYMDVADRLDRLVLISREKALELCPDLGKD